MNWNWGIIYIWLCPLGEHLDFRTGGTLPVTNGRTESRSPSSLTFYGVQGFFCALSWPSCKTAVVWALAFLLSQDSIANSPQRGLLHQYQLLALSSVSLERPWGSVQQGSTPCFCQTVGLEEPSECLGLCSRDSSHHSSKACWVFGSVGFVAMRSDSRAFQFSRVLRGIQHLSSDLPAGRHSHCDFGTVLWITECWLNL